MEIIGEYTEASRLLSGDLIISFVIDDDMETVRQLNSLAGEQLAIDIDKYRKKRSLNANRYFWKLCNEIAKVIGSDKDTVYLLQLKKYGVWVDLTIQREALEGFRRLTEFRVIEDMTDGYKESDTAYIRGYYGSSRYDTKEMSILLNGTISDAHDLGIKTWEQAEIDRLIAEWKGER